MQQLRAQGYTRTASRACRPRGSDASYAIAQGDAPLPPPRRGSLGRSLLVASALGATTGAALLAWDYYDPATAAPVKNFAYDSLDAAIHSFHRARDAAQPYVDQLLGSASSQLSALTSGSLAPRSAERVAPKPAIAPPATPPSPSLSAGAEGAKADEDEEEKRAKIILLEGVKQVQEEEDDDDEDDVVGAVVASDEDAAPGTSHTLEETSHSATHAAKTEPAPAHDAAAEIERKRAAEEAELRRRLEEDERKAEVEAERRREEKQRAQEEAERQEREEAVKREKEREEALDRLRKNIEERKKARIEQHAKEEEERAKREAAERPPPAEAATAEKKEAAPSEEGRKGSIREHLQKRRDQMDKMRLAAIEAKQKREEAEVARRQQSVPPRLLSPQAPDAHHPSPAHTDSAANHVKPVLHAPTAPAAHVVDASAPAAEKKQSDETDKVQAAIAAAVEKARKEEQEKFSKLLQEKERLASRVHLSEAENYASQWQKSMSQVFESISHEMASRKFMNSADFAHLSAIFTGYISLKNALDKEQPFANELQALKRVIHDDLAQQVIDSIPTSAAAGVPTLQRITTSFEQNLVPSVRQVAFTANDSDYPMPLQHLRRTFAWYVLGSLRIKSPSEVSGASSTYQEAERALALTHEALNKGDLMSALQEIRRLPAPVSAIGKNWAQGLHDRLVVEQATTIFDALIPPAK